MSNLADEAETFYDKLYWQEMLAGKKYNFYVCQFRKDWIIVEQNLKYIYAMLKLSQTFRKIKSTIQNHMESNRLNVFK